MWAGSSWASTSWASEPPVVGGGGGSVKNIAATIVETSTLALTSLLRTRQDNGAITETATVTAPTLRSRSLLTGVGETATVGASLTRILVINGGIAGISSLSATITNGRETTQVVCNSTARRFTWSMVWHPMNYTPTGSVVDLKNG